MRNTFPLTAVRLAILDVGRWAVAAAVLAASLSCGDPLLSDKDFQTPLLAIEGYLQPFPVDGLKSPRVTVVWFDFNGQYPDVPADPKALSFDIDAAGAFHLGLLAPPPGKVMPSTGASGSGGRVQFMLAELVLFDDVDGDGSMAISPVNNQIVGPDVYRGATSSYIIAYIESTSGDVAHMVLPFQSVPGPGYRLGTIDCSQLGPISIALVDSSQAVAVMQVVPASAELPYLRTCLQSHPLGP
jgi:hypothetical protein